MSHTVAGRLENRACRETYIVSSIHAVKICAFSVPLKLHGRTTTFFQTIAMDQTTDIPDPSDASAFHRYVNSIPYDKRWKALRPVLEPLFYTESLKDIAKIMLDRFQFKAK